MKKKEYLSLPLFSEKMKDMLLGMLVKQKSIVPLALNQILQNVENDYLDKHDEFSKIMSIRMLDLRKDGDFFVLSYLPLNKEPEYTVNGKWARKNRQDGKIGRMIKTFLNPYLPLIGSQIKDSDVETFVNGIKGYLSRNTLIYKLVKGEDIVKYYSFNNYADFCDSNSLHNSCMSDTDCQTFFDIYSKNPDCEMLIMFDKTISEENIVGRAIVWNKNGKKYVDRRYYMLDMYHASMIEYIKSQEWCYKTNNTYTNDVNTIFSCPDENGVYSECEVVLTYDYSGIQIDKFPYMDTLKYWDFKTLTNDHNLLPDLFHELCYTNGGYNDEDNEDYEDDEDESNNVICARCQSTINYYDSRYSESDDEYYCDECSVESMNLMSHINIDDAVIVFHLNGDGYIHKNELQSNAILINGSYYLTNYDLPVDPRAIILDDDDNYFDEDEISTLINQGYAKTIIDNKEVIYLPIEKPNEDLCKTIEQ